MATQTEKDLEKKRQLREKELKILKAQNEMLEDVKRSVIAHHGWKEEDNMEGVIAEIETAKQDNLKMAMAYHQASADEVDSVEYNKVSKKGIEEYNRRLEARNLTDEMLHQKQVVVTATTLKDKEEKGKRVRKTKVVKNTQSKSEKVTKEVKSLNPVFVPHPTIQTSYKSSEWDLSDVPDYVQFDMIPLPSNGECYAIDSPLRSGVIPVSYLTASDENLIHSPNMYRDGKIIDVIINRKILDKRVKSSDLCKGDRDAITLWLRATGYGDNFPIVVRNPQDTEKVYNTSINLSDLHYIDFKLHGDENGLFEYVNDNNVIFKFKQISKADEEHLKKVLTDQFTVDTKLRIFNAISDVKYYFEQIQNQEFEEKEEIKLDIEEIVEWATNIEDELEEEESTFNVITESMILRTVSINGNDSEEYIRGYIENMKAKDAYDYRTFMDHNTPGVDFKIKVNLPESDGGGSFDTFLRIDELIFRNV